MSQTPQSSRSVRRRRNLGTADLSLLIEAAQRREVVALRIDGHINVSGDVMELARRLKVAEEALNRG